MFNPFRALGRLWGTTNATPDSTYSTTQTETRSSVNAAAPSTETNGTQSSNSTSTPLANHRPATSAPDYQAAFGYAAPPLNYAIPVVQTVPRSSFGRPAQPPKSSLDVTGAPSPTLTNIPPPRVSLFGTSSASSAHSHVPGDEHADVSMSEAPPQPTPLVTPRHENTSAPSTLYAGNIKCATTIQTYTHESRYTSGTPTSVKCSGRPQLQPGRPQDCRRDPVPSQPSKKDWVNEIVYEAENPEDPLPSGYTGTFRRIRYYAADYKAMLPCGDNGFHHLICGHYIASSDTCGRNCKTEVLGQTPFNCPTCRDVVDTLLNNRISANEQTKLKKLQNIDIALLNNYCIEIATRSLPQLKAGVSEAVTAFLNTGYGRLCGRSNGPSEVKSHPLRDMVRDMQANYEARQRRKMAEETPLNAHKKRKGCGEANNVPANAHTESQTRVPGDEETAVETESRVKKQKQKWESHREPITPETRGRKRSSSAPYSPSSFSSSSTSSYAFNPTCEANKKRGKYEFVSHSSSITRMRGTKRSSPSSDDSSDSIRSEPPTGTKKLCTQPAPWGQVGFLQQPQILGPLVRKRDIDANNAHDEEAEGDGMMKRERLAGWKKVERYRV